jgi:hypothetical protein
MAFSDILDETNKRVAADKQQLPLEQRINSSFHWSRSRTHPYLKTRQTILMKSLRRVQLTLSRK